MTFVGVELPRLIFLTSLALDNSLRPVSSEASRAFEKMGSLDMCRFVSSLVPPVHLIVCECAFVVLHSKCVSFRSGDRPI